MSFSETDFDRNHRDASVVLSLVAALADQSPWVRVGAAQTLAQLYPEEGREALRRQYYKESPNSREQFAIVLALEVCGEDTFPLLAPMLRVESPEDLVNALGLSVADRGKAHDDWVYFLRSKREYVSSAALGMVSEIRPLRRWRQTGDAHKVQEESQTDHYERAADTLERELSKAMSWLNNDEFAANSTKLFSPILASLRSKEGERIRTGILALVNFALREPNGWYREASQTTLAALGDEAGDLLLPGLWGEPPAEPDSNEVSALASQANFEWNLETSGDDQIRKAIGAFFVTKTLEKFTDEQTVSAVVSAAVEGSTRAEEALADMPLEVSIPALVWAALNKTDWDDRRSASSIIHKIVSKDPNYPIHYHRVDWRQVDADLQWVEDLVSRAASVPTAANYSNEKGALSWVRNKPATMSLLRNSMLMIPLMEGTKEILYQDSSAWDRFVDHTNRIVARLRGGKKPSTTSIERYMDCTFPKQCVLNEPTRLTVRLGLTPPTGETPAPMVNLDFAEGEIEVKLMVLVRAPGFAIEPNYQVLTVPLNEASHAVHFELTPNDSEAQTIEITLLRDAERVGYTCLSVNVVPDGIHSGQAESSLLETTSNRDLLRLGETRAVIQVEWMKDGTLSYSVIDPSLGSSEPKLVGISPSAVLKANVPTWTAQQGEIIKDYLKEDYATPSDLEDALAGITSIGHTLSEQLAPPELATFIQRWARGSIIAIDSNEGWVPWELLTDSPSGPVWGDRFQLIRVPRMPLEKNQDLKRLVPRGACTQPCTEIRKIASIVGDGINRGSLPGEYSAKQTFGKAESLVSDLIEGGFNEFSTRVKDADIVHLTCHGRGTPFYYLSLGPGAGRRLLIGQVETLDIKPGAVIFANACSSDKPELFLSEFQNFGWKFFVRGARPFIGTLGPVPTKHAITFAQHFYEWFILKGLPAGQALRQAREDMAKKFNNPFYLFYCLYGPASACRRIHPVTS